MYPLQIFVGELIPSVYASMYRVALYIITSWEPTASLFKFILWFLLIHERLYFLQTNTFQGILATDFARSFAVFTYMCGDLSYSDRTLIGFISDFDIYALHPAANRSNAMAIACLNYPNNIWVNVVYQLTEGKLNTIYIQVWSLSIMSHTCKPLCTCS